MEERKNCKIIQDLLPSYIEKLTNEETNQYIESHLKDCQECKKALEDMQKDLKLNATKTDNREVKYIKKFNHKLRTLKVILLIILIIFVIVVGRKMIIITNLSNKAEQYTTSTNYHRIIYSYYRDSYMKTEIYCLDNKIASISTIFVDGNKTIKKMYSDGNKVNIYWETDDRKTANLNIENLEVYSTPQNVLYTENFGQLLINSIKSSIYEVRYNGKDCYFVSGFTGLYFMNHIGTYIDKETGLIEGTLSTDLDNTATWSATDYVFEFNTVTEADFIEPDISEYEVQ